MRQRLLSSLAILLAATLPLAISASAQEEIETPNVEKAEPEAERAEADAEAAEEDSRFSGALQADFTNAYFFRGILQERDSFIAQPWGEGYFSFYRSEDCFIRDASVGAGVWFSFHSETTGSTHGPKSLYETDLYPIVYLEFPHSVSLTTIYYWYFSPNGAFHHTEELNFKLAWDDSETLGRFALQPWVNLAMETHGTAFGVNKGEGMQFGIEPTLFEIPIVNYPITVTAPVEVGIAINDYYERDNGHESTWGYASYGITASVPLAFMPEAAGSWTLALTGKGYSLSHALANANLGRDFSPVGVASIGVEF